jgi:hypothetical protein
MSEPLHARTEKQRFKFGCPHRGTFRSLVRYCIRTYLTISQAVERSIVKEMRDNPQLGYNWQENVAHLRAAQASIHVLTALGKAVAIAGTVRVAGNIHTKEPRRQRRNEISERTTASFREVYELPQTWLGVCSFCSGMIVGGLA